MITEAISTVVAPTEYANLNNEFKHNSHPFPVPQGITDKGFFKEFSHFFLAINP
jgi:hypothetical protein